MTRERKANVEARLAELEHELRLAIKQGSIKDHFGWHAAIQVPGGGEPFIVLLTVAKVEELPG